MKTRNIYSLMVVLLAAYLILCATVCRNVMFPNTCVNGHDLSGKTLNVFATSGGSDVKDSYNDLKKAYPQYTWGDSRLMN